MYNIYGYTYKYYILRKYSMPFCLISEIEGFGVSDAIDEVSVRERKVNHENLWKSKTFLFWFVDSFASKYLFTREHPCFYYYVIIIP